MNYSTLNELIEYLEYGTNLHIGVLFFGSYGNEKLILPGEREIHTSRFCAKMKASPNGYRRCFYCRNSAIRKALESKEAFGGLCINGIYEYTRPVVMDGNVICVIFIGNIAPEISMREKFYKNVGDNKWLLPTLEENFTPESCERVGEIIESYVRMIMELSKENGDNTDFDPLIENLKSYIEANLEYDIDISLIADIFHYNEKYLGRLFKKRTGFSFSEWLNKRRIERGRKMLLSSKDSIISISSKIGFNNVTYFNRVFKKQYGVTPSEYRRKK